MSDFDATQWQFILERVRAARIHGEPIVAAFRLAHLALDSMTPADPSP